jgi:hypothetical protein
VARRRPLFVLLARDRPVAVILRRGPSDWFHVISWDTARDRFEHGAWLRGRIYEDRCDLSPDGELLLAFVMQGRKSGSSTTHAWSAVSRPPWLHALALWPQGTTYGGGGRFTGKRSLVLRSGAPRAHPDHPATGLEVTAGNPPLHASSAEVEGAEWSGRDHAGHVVFTRGYALLRRVGDREATLAHFEALIPDPQPAPASARKPLAPTSPRSAPVSSPSRRR